MAFSNEDANRKFTESFSLVILGEEISWVPGAIDLVVDPLNERAREIKYALEEFVNVFCGYGYEVAATPVGPYLVNEITNPYTFVWAAFSKYDPSKIEVRGKAPTMADLGLSGRPFDKKKNPRIY